MLVNKFNIGTPGDGAGFSWLRPGLEAATEAEMNVSHLFTRNLAQAFFGHFYNIPEVIAKAQADYGKHLLMLKRELEIPGSIVSAHLFRGIMAAVMYECVACNY